MQPASHRDSQHTLHLPSDMHRHQAHSHVHTCTHTLLSHSTHAHTLSHHLSLHLCTHTLTHTHTPEDAYVPTLHIAKGPPTLSQARQSPRPWSPGSPHHAFHAVGQQQHNAIVSNPLGLTGADKLVNDALGRVVEVTKLSLPEDQGIGAGHGIA